MSGFLGGGVDPMGNAWYFKGWYFWRSCEKVGFRWEIHLSAKGTRKKLAMEREKSIWKVLVVHDRKYHLFLAPSAGRGKVGGERKRVQRSQKKIKKILFYLYRAPWGR